MKGAGTGGDVIRLFGKPSRAIRVRSCGVRKAFTLEYFKNVSCFDQFAIRLSGILLCSAESFLLRLDYKSNNG